MDIPPYERMAFEHELAQTLAHDIGVFAESCRQSEQRCYALVSVGQCEEIQQNRQDDSRMARLVQRHMLEVEALFWHTPEAELAGIGPWLIELPLSSQGTAMWPALLHELALEAGVVHALSLVASPLRPLTLARHMRSWMKGLILPDPGLVGDEAVGAVLRWFDPRIGFDMVSLWPESEQRDFLRAFTWAGWDARFEPRGMRCSRPRAPASAERTEPLPLDMPLLQAIAPLSRAEELLDDVRQQAEAKAFDHIAPALQCWVAIDQLSAIQRLAIDDHDSKITLLHHALSLHPGLSRLPGLKERLAEEARSGGVLAHVLDAQSEQWWQEHREAAAGVWAQWAHHFLMPLQARLAIGGAAHPFMALLPPALHLA